MLVLNRNDDQRIRIETSDGPITIVVCRDRWHQGIPLRTRVGIDAPTDCKIWRQEVYDKHVANKEPDPCPSKS